MMEGVLSVSLLSGEIFDSFRNNSSFCHSENFPLQGNWDEEATNYMPQLKVDPAYKHVPKSNGTTIDIRPAPWHSPSIRATNRSTCQLHLPYDVYRGNQLPKSLKH